MKYLVFLTANVPVDRTQMFLETAESVHPQVYYFKDYSTFLIVTSTTDPLSVYKDASYSSSAESIKSPFVGSSEEEIIRMWTKLTGAVENMRSLYATHCSVVLDHITAVDGGTALVYNSTPSGFEIRRVRFESIYRGLLTVLEMLRMDLRQFPIGNTGVIEEDAVPKC